jgi:hypothetical protein
MQGGFRVETASSVDDALKGIEKKTFDARAQHEHFRHQNVNSYDVTDLIYTRKKNRNTPENHFVIEVNPYG